jgi:hypothetical protein
MSLIEYAVVEAGASTSYSNNGSAISDPTNYLATNGDVITVTATNANGCQSTASFSVQVNDRQKFGVCAPIAGKVYEIIGSELTMLQRLFDPQNPTVTNEVFFISGDKVLIEIIFYEGQLAALQPILQGANMGFELDADISDFEDDRIIAGFFPIQNLNKLNTLSSLIQFVRPAFPPVSNIGDATSQGDTVMRSYLVRKGYFNASTNHQLSGSGIKVGVLSDSYNTLPLSPATTDVGNWDLPGAANHPFGTLPNVNVLKDFPTKYGSGKDEGRAMLQIIHDVAPSAELAFRTGFLTAGDFAKGILELKAADCDVIVDDITYITEPFFTDGKVAQTVNQVAGDGVSYFTSAGNFGSKSFEGTFNGVEDASITLPLNGGVLAGKVHAFSAGDTDQTLTVYPNKPGEVTNYTIALQWNDPLYSIGQTGTQYDLDIYLKNFQGAPLFGFNRNNIGGDPIEILSFSVSSKTEVKLVIAQECESCTATDIKFKYIIFRGELNANDANEYFTGSSTIVGHANAEGAMTVGAILYSITPDYNFDVPAATPAIEPFTVATFSSIGGMLDRAKPDFTAPNGVNTTVDFDPTDKDDIENDKRPNFFGTSASAPHAAAVAALVLEARNYYYPTALPKHKDNTDWAAGTSSNDIRKVLQSTATNMHASDDEAGNFDRKSGYGLVRADAALLTLATPNPEIIKLDTSNVVGRVGEVEFKLIIEGDNFYEDSEILFRGEPLPTTYNATTENLETTIPPFEGNPAIQVRNNAISELGTDGGTTAPEYP